MEDNNITLKDDNIPIKDNKSKEERKKEEEGKEEDIPIFPIFELQFIEMDKDIYLLGGGGGGNPEFGKRNGLILFKKSIIKNKEPFIEHLYFETETIVKKIFTFKEKEKQYILLETEPFLYILILKKEIEFEKIGIIENKNIFSFEKYLYIKTLKNILIINYKQGIHYLNPIPKKIKNILFFNYNENICVIKKENYCLININKKIYKINKEIKHIYSFEKDLFLALKDSVLYLNEFQKVELLIKFCTKITKNYNNYTFSSADGHVYIYKKDLNNNLNIFWIKKVYDLAITAASYNSIEKILSYSSYDCSLYFTKIGYQKKYYIILLLLILWFLGIIFVLKIK